MANRLKMNSAESNQQLQQQQQNEQQPGQYNHLSILNELHVELTHKSVKLNQLMLKSAQKHAAKAKLNIHVDIIKKK